MDEAKVAGDRIGGRFHAILVGCGVMQFHRLIRQIRIETGFTRDHFLSSKCGQG
jgi:hypothetical protein